jgi:hypothetical protein
MPNWCENRLTVSGPTYYVDRFMQKAKGEDNGREKDYEDSDLSLDALMPLPDSEKDNWYDWRIKHWGTKWDVKARIVEEVVNGDNKSVTYFFDSAWSPPVDLIASIVDDFVNLRFRLAYAEGGMGFVGIAEGDATDGFMDSCESTDDWRDFCYRAAYVGFEYYLDSYKDWEAEMAGQEQEV